MAGRGSALRAFSTLGYRPVVEIFLLWHVRHAGNREGTPTEHRDEEGALVWNEEEGDDLKILGAYSTEERARDRVARTRQLPGFRDEPDCFYVDRYTVDEDHWQDGFVTVPPTESGEQEGSSAQR
jgi:hypothetical protein